MRRFGMVARVKPDMVEKYKKLHASPWPSVVAMIERCHIRNYSIFLKEMPGGETWLFSYFEYTGDDFDTDMSAMAADPETQRWWTKCKPCLETMEDIPPGELWAPMESVFFQP